MLGVTSPQFKRLGRDLFQTLLPLALGIAVTLGGNGLATLLALPFLAVAGTLSGMCLCGLGTLRLVRRVLLPGVDLVELYHCAQVSDPGRAWQGLCIVIAALVLALAGGAARAADLPANAAANLPILKAELKAHWPGMPLPSAVAAQVEQETCISLKHSRCWSPRAELRTAREQGVGLGQVTRTARFDVLAELRTQFPRQLAGWAWDSPTLYDPALQLRALVLMDRRNWQAVTGTASDRERLAMTLASYNGGLRGLAADRALCKGTAGCDSSRWFGQVERTCTKSQTAAPGYGRSFCDINRGYVVAVLDQRRAKYVAAMVG